MDQIILLLDMVIKWIEYDGLIYMAVRHVEYSVVHTLSWGLLHEIFQCHND